MRKVANKQKKQDLQSRMKNKTYFSLWMLDLDVQDDKHDLLSY